MNSLNNNRKRIIRLLKKVHDQNNALKSFADKIRLKKCKEKSIIIKTK